MDSWWQDCTFRIESLNIIISTADTLVSGKGADKEGYRGRLVGSGRGYRGEGRLGDWETKGRELENGWREEGKERQGGRDWG